MYQGRTLGKGCDQTRRLGNVAVALCFERCRRHYEAWKKRRKKRKIWTRE